MDVTKLRAWYSHQQGLDGSFIGRKPADVLAKTGWARSVGGAAPYLTLFARAGTSREAADQSVAALDIHELPSVRGCTYVLPAGDFALGLRVGQSFADNEMKVARKLGVTDKEIDKLCEAVVSLLSKGSHETSHDTEEIRTGVGKAARSLGEEGKKKGVSTTLPLALGKLQALGEIRRVPINGRLDQQRYKYAAWRPNPLRGFKLSEGQCAVELARRYFAWIGPATAAEFQAFAGLGVKASQAALEPLKLEAFQDRLWLSADRARFETLKVPKDPQYALVSSLDGIGLLRGDLGRMIDPADQKKAALGQPSGLDLPGHAILDRGRLVGLWAYDTETETIAWFAFIQRNKDLEKAVARTEEYVREQLGDARSFSLDSPKSRAPRVQALRKAAAS
jgi:hypothetical protein